MTAATAHAPSGPLVSSARPATGLSASVTGPGTAVSHAPGKAPGPLTLVSVVAVVGGMLLGVIGFAGSYGALTELAEQKGFGEFAPYFPVGLDAGILVLLALDLYLIHKRAQWPLLRVLAHGLTAATIWFNAASAWPDEVAAAMHAVLPALFVISVEAARRLVIKAANLKAGRLEFEGVPLHRWLLAPGSSFAMFRRMKLYGIASYDQAVERERERVVYRVMLEQRHGSVRKASSVARLPLTMAPYGLTVDEALALPQEAEEAEQERQDRVAAHSQQMQERAELRETEAEISRLRAQGAIETARADVAARNGVAQAQARAAQAQATAAADAQERATAVEREAEESAAAADARRHAAAADLTAATDRDRAAEIDQAAAETELRAGEARRRTAVAEQETAEAQAATSRAAAEAEAARQRTAEARERAAEIELRVLEAEDLTKFSPRERTARKVARMILAVGGDPDAVELSTIADALNVSVTTASERRREAAELLRSGYTPETAVAS